MAKVTPTHSALTRPSGFLHTLPNRHLLVALSCGLVFLVVFWFAYSRIPSSFYTDRDDGIITLSHAKNLVEYGSIGVNPSGERVEGFSSPLQFIVYWILYSLIKMSYSTYSTLQTYLCAFFIGFIFIKFFRDRYLIGLPLSVIGAILLTRDFSFIQWHGSGMENALTHCMLLLAVYLLYASLSSGRINYLYTLPIFAAAISRIEAMYHIFPLLVVFSFFWVRHQRDSRGVIFSGIVVFLWLLLNLLRYHYFGHLLPNTALAQDVPFLERLQRLASLAPPALEEGYRYAKKIALTHYGFLFALSLPVAFLGRRLRENLFLWVALSCLILTALLSPFFFGPTRIDTTRTTTQMALVSVTFGCTTLAYIDTRRRRLRTLLLFLPAFAILFALTATRAYYIGYLPERFLKDREQFLSIAEQERIHRPTLANPDLGIISWHKDFNVFDLGLLGNLTLSQLMRERRYKESADLFFEIAQPDIVKIHGGFAVRFLYLTRDPRFVERYVEVVAQSRRRQKSGSVEFRSLDGRQPSHHGIWVRKDIMLGSDCVERRFMDRLQAGPSLDVVKDELRSSLRQEGSGDPNYIARTIYRFLPEFTKRGEYSELMDILSEYQREVDLTLALLSGRANSKWDQDYISYIAEYSARRRENQREASRNRADNPDS